MWSPLAVVIIVAVVVLCIVFVPAKTPTLSLSAKPIVVEVESSKTIEFSCSDPNAKIDFEIGSEAIASVADGKIIGNKIGTTTLKITATLGKDSSFINVNVTVIENHNLPVVDLEDEITLYLLDKDISSANAAGYYNEISFRNYTSYTFDSSVSNIVKCSGNTLVANKVGESTLTFSSTTSSKVTTVKVKVMEINPKLENLPAEVLLKPDEIYNLNYRISPSYYTGEANVEMFATSDIIDISNNVITAKFGGSCEIGVKLNGKIVASIPVTVELPVRAEIIPVSNNCEFENNLLKILDNEEVVFKIRIVNEKGDAVSSYVPYLVSDLDINEQLSAYHLHITIEGVINIYVAGYPKAISTIFVCFS